MRASIPLSLKRAAPSARNSAFGAALAIGAVWLRRIRERSRMRRQLSALFAVASDRDLNDMPVCWSHIGHEVNKPFWRE